MSDIQVLKRDGRREPFQLDKIHRVLEWAVEDITGVSISEIELRANIELYDGIPAYDIHELLIKSAAELITEDTPNYQYVAGRLINYKLRKEVYGQYEPHLLEHVINRNVAIGFYSDDLIRNYSPVELEELNEMIDHTRDNDIAYVGMEQMRGKYLVKDKLRKIYFETPQILYMAVAMTLFMNEKENRLEYIKEFYDMASKHYISLPTPIMAGCRTPIKQFSSCVLIESGDSLDSINGTSNAIVSYVSKKAGIGINAGALRAEGSLVGRDKSIVHTGVLPFLKLFQASVKSCSQGGVRGGAATVNFPIWHLEFENLVVAKNNKGTEETRARHVDYCFHLNKLFYERLIKGEHITLFSPDVLNGELYGAFYSDQSKFRQLYESLEEWIDWAERGVKTQLELRAKFGCEPMYKRLPAMEVFSQLVQERKETGRVYIMNVDHANHFGSFIPDMAPIKMTNLCCLSENQRVVTSEGLKTVKELYESGNRLALFNNDIKVPSTSMKKLRENEPVYRINTHSGLTHDVTLDHKVRVLDGQYWKNQWSWKEIKNLKHGDKICIQTEEGLFGCHHNTEMAFLLGLYHADGTQTDDQVFIDIWEHDFDLIEEIENCVANVYNRHGWTTYKVKNQTQNVVGERKSKIPTLHERKVYQSEVRKKRLGSTKLKQFGFEKMTIPDWLWCSDKETQSQYIRGLYIGDGTIQKIDNDKSKFGNGWVLSLTSIDYEFLKNLQLILANFGIKSTIHTNKNREMALLPNGKGGLKEYDTKPSWRILVTNRKGCQKFEKLTGFFTYKGYEEINSEEVNGDNVRKYVTFENLEYVGNQDVYCCEVMNDEHAFIANGIITKNCEITLPTDPVSSKKLSEGEVALCTLGAINWGKIEQTSDFERPCRILVRALDNLLSYQDYMHEAAYKATVERRPLGIGIINLAYFLAKRDLGYNKKALRTVDEYAEAWAWHLINASVDLAIERGECPLAGETKYKYGIHNIYKAEVDELVKPKARMPWGELSEKLKRYGIRNSTLMACMPSETSAQIANATNGVEPPRALVSYKQSKDGVLPQVVPEILKLKNKYDLLWDQKTPEGYLMVMAVLQKWIDQSISVNTSYNPAHFKDEEIPLSQLIGDILFAYKYGLKTLYYNNTHDGAGEDASMNHTDEIRVIDEPLEEDCDACKL